MFAHHFSIVMWSVVMALSRRGSNVDSFVVKTLVVDVTSLHCREIIYLYVCHLLRIDDISVD